MRVLPEIEQLRLELQQHPTFVFLTSTDTLLEIVNEASHSSSYSQIGSLVQRNMGLESVPKRRQAQLLALVTSDWGRIYERGTLGTERLGNADSVAGSISGLCRGGSL